MRTAVQAGARRALARARAVRATARLGVLLIAACGVGAHAVRQEPGRGGKPEPVVTWSLSVPASATMDAPFAATVQATVKPGWKVYALEQTASGPRPLKITPTAQFTLDGPVVPTPGAKTVKDTIWGELVSYHEGTTTFRVPVRPVPGSPEPAPFALTVRYQACSDELCLRPMQVTLEVPGGAR